MISHYDKETDSLYITLRSNIEVTNTIELTEDIMVDFGEDNHIVGYDIQFASKYPGIIERIETNYNALNL